MKKDPELEAMSDMIRAGAALPISDILRVIDYQKELQRERERIREGKWWYRFWKKIKGLYDKARQS